METKVEKVFVFNGKNWKLASEKKWKEVRTDTLVGVDINALPTVGEFSIKGILHKVLKGADIFLAIPK